MVVATTFARNDQSSTDPCSFGEAVVVACNHVAFRTKAIIITIAAITSFIDCSFIGVTLELEGLTS